MLRAAIRPHRTRTFRCKSSPTGRVPIPDLSQLQNYAYKPLLDSLERIEEHLSSIDKRLATIVPVYGSNGKCVNMKDTNNQLKGNN